MAHRPTERKKLRKLRRLMRRTPPAYINLFEWLKDRGYAQTTGEARTMILAGQVKSESHTVGIAKAYDPLFQQEVPYAEPFIKASLKDGLRVEPTE
jgi:hypothetical protein